MWHLTVARPQWVHFAATHTWVLLSLPVPHARLPGMTRGEAEGGIHRHGGSPGAPPEALQALHGPVGSCRAPWDPGCKPPLHGLLLFSPLTALPKARKSSWGEHVAAANTAHTPAGSGRCWTQPCISISTASHLPGECPGEAPVKLSTLTPLLQPLRLPPIPCPRMETVRGERGRTDGRTDRQPCSPGLGSSQQTAPWQLLRPSPNCTLTFLLQLGLAASADTESFIWGYISASQSLEPLKCWLGTPIYAPLPCRSQLCLPLPCYLTKTLLQNKHRSRSYEQVFIC